MLLICVPGGCQNVFNKAKGISMHNIPYYGVNGPEAVRQFRKV